MKTSHFLTMIAVPLSLMWVPAKAVQADSATWALDPVDFQHWGNAANWIPNTVPNGPDEIATFNRSNIPQPFLISDIEVNSLVFQPDASIYTIEPSGGTLLTLDGEGIINDSGAIQTFDLLVVTAGKGGAIQFDNTASAGTDTKFIVRGGMSGGLGSTVLFDGSSSAGGGSYFIRSATSYTSRAGLAFFAGHSTAADGVFTNNGGEARRAAGGMIQFTEESTAGQATIFSEAGARPVAQGGLTQFLDNSSAENAFIMNYGAQISDGAAGGVTQFLDDSTAGNSMLTSNGGENDGPGGSIQFNDDSSGGAAQVELYGNGELEISGHNLPGITIGSLEGDGSVFLGGNKLTLGRNSLTTTFSGVIQDGGMGGGSGGIIDKIGNGIFTLSKANLYTGGTI